MAARRSERAAAPAAQKGREARATSRMAEGGDDAAAAPKAGMGLGDAMGIVTFLLLIAAIVLTDSMLGKQYGGGMFFK
ncbi:MAG: hypothetical protein NTY35_13745 [Planctomycetota bacterium]|nr:hypothetical protein [Planctomycetota bacterium]